MIIGFASLVHASQSFRAFTKPLFNANAPLALRNARHPLLDPLGDKGFIPNNVYLSQCMSMVIVHGANMSGKTTYATTVSIIGQKKYGEEKQIDKMECVDMLL